MLNLIEWVWAKTPLFPRPLWQPNKSPLNPTITSEPDKQRNYGCRHDHSVSVALLVMQSESVFGSAPALSTVNFNFLLKLWVSEVGVAKPDWVRLVLNRTNEPVRIGTFGGFEIIQLAHVRFDSYKTTTAGKCMGIAPWEVKLLTQKSPRVGDLMAHDVMRSHQWGNTSADTLAYLDGPPHLGLISQISVPTLPSC